MRFVFALPIITACASISPRFEQDVAASFAHDDMRRLVTADVELYYPANYSEQAHRVAARASECLEALRAHQLTQRDHGRALLFLTSANINNAFVSGQLQGEPLHSLEPLSATWELFNWYGLPVADTGDIACHEMFHTAHFEQVEGLWRYVNLIVGPIASSQIYLEPWFTEGLAQYYEGRIARATGRPHSPMYKGTFDAFVAARGGDLKGGDLSPSQRELLPATGAYLTGLYFVEWLAETYGEAKLWSLMELQGRSLFSPLGATLRFRSVYGASAGALLDRWQTSLKERLVVRARPADQRMIRTNVGMLARSATHPPSGTIAIVSVGLEEVATLRILSADGSMLAERRLKRLTPDRDWVSIGPSSVSGLSFSADGRFLFLLNDDLVERGDTRAQIWKVDVATLEIVRIWQDVGRGTGGSVSPDGQRYTFVELPPSGAARVVERELETGKTEVLYEPPRGVGLGTPSWNADHSRLALALHDGNGWNLAVRSQDGRVRRLTSDGAFNYAPQWVDERHLVFARTAGSYLQAHRIDIETGRLERLSDTPYGIMDPSPVPGGVAIINRDGTHWSLDVVPDDAKETLREGAPWPAEPEEVAVARHEPPPLTVEEDSAYSPLDHLFIPQLRAPAVLLGLGKDRAGRPFLITSLYASLSGRDRLGFHNWALNAELDLPLRSTLVWAGYRNLQLAPFSITAQVSREGYWDVAYWSGALSVDRTIFTVPVSLGGRLELAQPFGFRTQRFIGPFASFAWGASEATAYGGVQRQLTFSLDAAAYPRALGSSHDMLDLRLGISLAVPLPISKRNSLFLSLIGRALRGAPEGSLRIGGISRGTAQMTGTRTADPRPGVYLPGGLVEGLRGFDDHEMGATAAALGTVRYRYAFIIDRGFLSTFYLLPSVFFRQVDAELFGSAALTDTSGGTWARAAGAAVFLRLLWGGWFSTSLYYQFAWRFDFGLPPLHVLGFAME